MPERRFSRVAALVAALGSAASARLGAQLDQPNQRSMYVSVVNDAGASVPGLGPSDFIVREDNVAREVVRVESADEPMQVEILVDTSEAADEYMRDVRTALPDFVDALLTPTPSGRRNEVGLVALGDRPTIVTASTFDAAELRKGIGHLFAQNGAANYLLEGIIQVCTGFKKRSATRSVIIAITTDGPEFSSRHFEPVLSALRDAGASLHIVVMGRLSSDTSDDAQNRNIVLDRGPGSSGGRFEHILTSLALGAKLTQIADELAHQYRVTFGRPQTMIPPETTSVNATRPGLIARGTLIKDQGGR